MLRFILLLFLLLLSPFNHAETQKSLAIVTCGGWIQPWDPDSIKSGITGSEEAVIYMSQELAKLGYKVSVLGNPPENSPYSRSDANPRYVSINSYDGTKFDIAISWRMPNIAGQLKTHARAVYLWPHDSCQCYLSAEQINDFTGVLWLSQWQRQQWMSINLPFAKFEKIFGNAIFPEQFKPVHDRTNPYSCIYGSNYGLGLEVLLDIWPDIKKQYPQATLDIYYGWQHWGMLSPEKEAKMRTQVAALAASGVTDHGLVGHEELNRAYEQASFWTYPCIGNETFCITAIRAQFAGAVPVIIEGSCFKETVRHGYKCQTAGEYQATLIKAMQEAEKITLADRQKMGDFIRKEYTWKIMAEKWKQHFDQQ
ncbi:MAG: glycosyltransferase family 1 protein [Parachlamydiaceae bacterium]